MTILGKVLMLFVLLLSMVTGGLIVKVYFTRTNWKLAYDEADRQTKVANANLQAEKDAARRDKEAMDVANSNLKKQLADEQVKNTGLTSQVANITRQRDDHIAKAATELANNEAATKEIEKLKAERDMNIQLIAKKNEEILRLNTVSVDHRNARVQAEIERDRAIEKNQKLALLVEQQSRILQDFKNRGLQASTGTKRPPAVEVKGKVTEVTGSLAQISLGKDHGLEKGDKLQVYRMEPEPLYLGTLELTNLEEHISVGIFTPAGRNSKIMKGDIVDTKVMPR